MEQESSKKNNIIVLCVVIAVIAVALVAYFVISGQKGDGSPTVSATMELNTVNMVQESRRQHIRAEIQGQQGAVI